MRNWSIERKVVAAVIGSAVLALGAAVVFFVWIRATSNGWPLLGICALAVVAFLLVMLLRYVYVDVRKHHNLELRLHRVNHFLETLLDNTPSMIFAKDAKDLRYLHFNRVCQETLGYSREQMIGQSDMELFPAEQAEWFARKDREALDRDSVVDVPEEEIETRHGKRILHTRKIPIKDANGEPMVLLGISVDITEHKRTEQRILTLLDDLKRYNTMLEASNQELESFCYSVSHDLRAPLRAINGHARLLELECGPALDEATRHRIDRICQASEHMARLIDDLLEFSRLGRQSLTKCEVDMRTLVQRIVDDLMVQDQSASLSIEVGRLLPVEGDWHMLSRVWLNLIDNAIKYTAGRPDRRIVIDSKRQHDEIVYRIQDNGVGFDMRYYDKIFRVFQRAHGSHEFPGTGVGLAIVERVLTRHGGRVWGHSEPGKGATFYFALPSIPTNTSTPAPQSAAAAI